MMNKKTILTTFVLTVVTASTFAAGLDNTINPTAAHYGAEAYGYINKYELAEQIRQLQSDNAELRQELNELRSMIENKK